MLKISVVSYLFISSGLTLWPLHWPQYIGTDLATMLVAITLAILAMIPSCLEYIYNSCLTLGRQHTFLAFVCFCVDITSSIYCMSSKVTQVRIRFCSHAAFDIRWFSFSKFFLDRKFTVRTIHNVFTCTFSWQIY